MRSERQLGMPHKAVYIAIALVCIMIGLAGLILPIIPGFLFLLGAVYCLSKVSRRFKYWAEQQPTLQQLQTKLSRLNTVDALSRVKVISLMGVEMMVQFCVQVVAVVKRGTRLFR